MCTNSTYQGFNQRGYVVSLACGQWSCPDCMRDNAKRWAWRVRLECKARHTEVPYFVTFTLPGYVTNLTYAFNRIVILWDRYRRDMQKRIKAGEFPGVERFIYCAFVEGQPKRSFMPHFHIIQFCPTPIISNRKERAIRDYAASLGWGYQAEIERVNDSKAASYVAKYASKQSPRTPKGFRRVRTSQGWAELPEPDHTLVYVKRRTENLSTFLLRVNEGTGVDIDTLYQRWVDRLFIDE